MKEGFFQTPEEEIGDKKEEKKKPTKLKMTGRGEIVSEKEYKDEIKRRQEHPGREQL